MFRCSPQGAWEDSCPPCHTIQEGSRDSSTWYMRWVIPLKVWGGKGDSELCLEGHPAWRLSHHLLSRENEQDAFSLACESLAVREDGVFAS